MIGYEIGAPVMMQLGEYQFGISTAAYQELTQVTEYRWAEHSLVGRRPVLQFIGIGGEDITLPFVIYPEYRGGFDQLPQMRAMAAAGKPLQMTDGTGGNLGRWVIERIEDTGSVFAAAGRARKIAGSLSLRFFPEAPATTTAEPAAALGGLIPAGAAGSVAQVKGLAGNVASSAKSISGALNKAAGSIQSAVAPFTSVARDGLGAVLRAGGVAGELMSTANRTLSLVGIRPVEITALAGANNLAAKAAGLIVSAESASTLLRASSARLDQLGNVPANATKAMREAVQASDRTVALVRSTAAQAATIKG